MSHNGIVYLMPGFVLTTLQTLAKKEGIIDWRLIRQCYHHDNIPVLHELSTILRGQGYLAYNIPNRYYGLRFCFESCVSSVPPGNFFNIPVKVELFGVEPSRLESLKTDYLKTIDRIIALGSTGA